MNKHFILAFRLRNTYRVNAIIYSLKSLPVVRKLLPSSLYASRGLKRFADIISGAAELLSIFLGKALYLLALFWLTSTMHAPSGDSFAHMLVFLTIIGGFLNTQMFNPTKDKFYAIFLMRMDAKRYALADYLYFLFKMLLGFAVFAPLIGRLAGASWLTCLSVPVYVIGIKLCFAAIILMDCKKQHKSASENKLTPLVWVCVAVLLAAAAAPYWGWALPQWVLPLLTALVLVPAGFALRYILKFDEYRPIYKDLLRPESFNVEKNAAGAAQQLAMQKKLSVDTTQTSHKSGYKYFNELFIKRHARLLTKSAKRIAVIAAVLFAAAAAALVIFPQSHEEVNQVLMNYLPYFLFVMYMINRGSVMTQAMFLNCDHSMLAYRFYRQPKALLALFVERLKYVVLINLGPAMVIGLGLPALLYLTGGTTQPLNYVVLFVSILAMSVFFSVHSMVLYYLLQPYNVNLESKNAAFSLVNGITYFVCYLCIRVKLPTLAFGAAISAFCIIYAVAAVVIAYKLAPKTFKLRN